MIWTTAVFRTHCINYPLPPEREPNSDFWQDIRLSQPIGKRKLIIEKVNRGTISYDVIATNIVFTLLPNNLLFFIVKIIMKIISNDIT